MLTRSGEKMRVYDVVYDRDLGEARMMARVYDYVTGDDLGEATVELGQASAAVKPTGVVGAYKNDDGVWIHVPEGTWAPDEVQSIYVAE